MLGHKIFQVLRDSRDFEVFSTVRSAEGLPPEFRNEINISIRPSVDADNFDTVVRALAAIQPDLVINCIGLIKHLPDANDPLTSITVNAQLPHRISLVCRAANARLIHISTDCVFKGDRGSYSEDESPDATDLYGRTKHLGEVEYPHCVTLRTSIIGHELRGHHGLVDWFLRSGPAVAGYKQAYFSGLPTCELARVIAQQVIPRPDLSGIYHVSAERISKYDLLCLVGDRYGARIEVRPSDGLTIDRSLRSDRFRNLTGYSPPSWEQLVDAMHRDFVAHANLYAK